MEQQELQRLHKEAAYKEELFNNHGKGVNYFKAPVLGAVKSNTNIRKLKTQEAEKENAQDAYQRKQKALSRNSKFALALDESHYNLVKLLKQRQEELNSRFQEIQTQKRPQTCEEIVLDLHTKKTINVEPLE